MDSLWYAWGAFGRARDTGLLATQPYQETSSTTCKSWKFGLSWRQGKVTLFSLVMPCFYVIGRYLIHWLTNPLKEITNSLLFVIQQVFTPITCGIGGSVSPISEGKI
jgi:hypothetical protein